MEYESDTFNSSVVELKDSEAEIIAEKFLDFASNNYLDGDLLSHFLEEIR